MMMSDMRHEQKQKKKKFLPLGILDLTIYICFIYTYIFYIVHTHHTTRDLFFFFKRLTLTFWYLISVDLGTIPKEFFFFFKTYFSFHSFFLVICIVFIIEKYVCIKFWPHKTEVFFYTFYLVYWNKSKFFFSSLSKSYKMI